MAKRIARQRKRKAAKPRPQSKRKPVLIVCSLLCLTIALGVMAAWKIVPLTSKPLALSPNPSGNFNANSPSKEYIYAGGRLVATEEPASTGSNSATFITQQVPSSMIAGQSYNVSVTMENTGTSTWTAANLYKLGSQNLTDNTIWRSPGRVDLPASVAPGAQATFSYSVTAPTTPGTYNFQWRMVRDGFEWFGAASTNISINVSAAGSSSTENVVWANAVGVAVNGNSLSKTTNWAWGNSGASSTRAITAGEGYVEYTVTDNHSSISMLGLSNADTNQDYTTINYGLHPAGSGTLYIYESGVGRGSVGSYAVGDKLRVSIEGGVIKYRKNGALLYTSTIAPAYPLRADTAFYSQGATASDVIISGLLQTVGGNTENVVWTNAFGLTVSGNSLTKSVDWGWGNSGASSTKALTSGDGYVEYTVTDNNSSISMLGLSHADANQGYTTIDYGLHPAGSGTLYVFEGGVNRGSVGPYATGDKLRVSVEGGVVKYRKNGVLLYTSTVAPTYSLRADTAFYSPGATASNAVIYGQWQ